VPRFGPKQPEPDSGAPGPAASDAAQRAFEEALGVARSDLAAVANEVGVIDVDVQSPTAPPDAGDRYDEALRSFMRAGEQLERAQRPADLVAVGEALEGARYELACIRALLDGAASPARAAPCLFDPRHGASAAEPDRRCAAAQCSAGAGLRGRRPAFGAGGGAGHPDRVGRRPAEALLGRAGPLWAAARRLLRALRRRPASVGAAARHAARRCARGRALAPER
jgi:hypothetical protein